jgi:O-antigen ligase
LVRTLGWASAAALVVLLVLPDIGRFAGVRQLAELSQGADVHNLRWRMELRWPYFWKKVVEHPWVGIGTDRDETLADTANTPHNGYLSIALRRGLPASVLTIVFGLLAAFQAWRVFPRRGATPQRLLALGVSAAILAVMTHNIGESTLVHPYIGKLFWVLVAIGAVSPSWATDASADTAQSVAIETPRGSRRGVRGRIPIRPIAPSPEKTA